MGFASSRAELRLELGEKALGRQVPRQCHEVARSSGTLALRFELHFGLPTRRGHRLLEAQPADDPLDVGIDAVGSVT